MNRWKIRYDKLLKEKEKLEEERDKYRELLLRSKADFENYKKEKSKELEKFKDFANQQLMLELIPVLDHLQMALSAGGDVESLKKGVEMVNRDFLNVLKKFGMEKIESEGKKFDPNFHEAIEVVKAKDVSPGMVVKEFQSGFILRGRLLRPARVAVSDKNDENKKEEKDG